MSPPVTISATASPSPCCPAALLLLSIHTLQHTQHIGASAVTSEVHLLQSCALAHCSAVLLSKVQVGCPYQRAARSTVEYMVKPTLSTSRVGRERSNWPTRRLKDHSSSPPLRCPQCLLTQKLPRLNEGGLSSSKAKRWLREGQAFVASAHSIVGERMLSWDFEHLRRHLPPSQKFDVFFVHDRLVMSHSTRYGSGAAPAASPDYTSASADAVRSAKSDVSALTFADFLAASERRAAGGAGGRPYLGCDLLRRANKQQAHPSAGPIGDRLLADLKTFGFAAMEAIGLPVMTSMHLFVGSSHTHYHTRASRAR